MERVLDIQWGRRKKQDDFGVWEDKDVYMRRYMYVCRRMHKHTERYEERAEKRYTRTGIYACIHTDLPVYGYSKVKTEVRRGILRRRRRKRIICTCVPCSK